MIILKKNTPAVFYFIPRINVDTTDAFKVVLESESKKTVQNKNCTLDKQLNRSILCTIPSFPTGKIGEKFSLKVINSLSLDIIYMDKMEIMDEFQDVQNYTAKKINTFYE